MNRGRFLAQIAWVFANDAEAILGSYAWPPKVVSTAKRREANRLHRIATELFVRAEAAGQSASGTDFVFGEGQ